MLAVMAAKASVVVLFVFELSNLIGLLSYKLEYSWIGLTVTTLVAYLLLTTIEYVLISRYNIYLHWVTWPLVFVMLAVDFSGDFFFLYDHWLPYDRLAHLSSGLILVPLIFSFYNRISWIKKWEYPLGINLLLALGSDVFLAVLYEIEEYSEDIIYHSHRLGNGFDTANDLLMNLTGAVVASVLIYFLIQEPQRIAMEEPAMASRGVLASKKTVRKAASKKKRNIKR